VGEKVVPGLRFGLFCCLSSSSCTVRSGMPAAGSEVKWFLEVEVASRASPQHGHLWGSKWTGRFDYLLLELVGRCEKLLQEPSQSLSLTFIFFAVDGVDDRPCRQITWRGRTRHGGRGDWCTPLKSFSCFFVYYFDKCRKTQFDCIFTFSTGREQQHKNTKTEIMKTFGRRPQIQHPRSSTPDSAPQIQHLRSSTQDPAPQIQHPRSFYPLTMLHANFRIDCYRML
jgi:hypothetical protein